MPRSILTINLRGKTMVDEVKAEPKVKVLRRLSVSSKFITDNQLKQVTDNYLAKTKEFAEKLKEVKIASAELKAALAPKLAKAKIDVNAGSDWLARGAKGDETGTLTIEIIQKNKEGTKTRIKAEDL